ncbi:hypothetical protein KUCAC02_034384 [Chaenocephalus aceratus]|nr:hypothetical protein KUCAC02_034384 [Chaenocephalus aceratus]
MSSTGQENTRTGRLLKPSLIECPVTCCSAAVLDIKAPSPLLQPDAVPSALSASRLMQRPSGSTGDARNGFSLPASATTAEQTMGVSANQWQPSTVFLGC